LGWDVFKGQKERVCRRWNIELAVKGRLSRWKFWLGKKPGGRARNARWDVPVMPKQRAGSRSDVVQVGAFLTGFGIPVAWVENRVTVKHIVDEV
jgi:hypothetical protein